MKTLIIGLFSLTLLASGTAWGAEGTLSLLKENPCKGKQVLVIVVNHKGKVKGYRCNELTGPQKSINSQPRAFAEGKPNKRRIDDIGIAHKHWDSGGDPCITWVSLGTSYTYCW